MLDLWCMTNYLWTRCNIWIVCWIMYDLGLYVGWFEILRDARRTTGFIWSQLWWFDCLSGCYCTCALINWMVLLHVPHPHLTLFVTAMAFITPWPGGGRRRCACAYVYVGPLLPPSPWPELDSYYSSWPNRSWLPATPCFKCFRVRCCKCFICML